MYYLIGTELGPFYIFFKLCKKKFWYQLYVTKKCMPSNLCGSDFYIWLAQTHFLGKKFMNSQTLCYLPNKCHGGHPRDPCKV
jgi:hypothetical protein